jgi:hypothetical protein
LEYIRSREYETDIGRPLVNPSLKQIKKLGRRRVLFEDDCARAIAAFDAVFNIFKTQVVRRDVSHRRGGPHSNCVLQRLLRLLKLHMGVLTTGLAF